MEMISTQESCCLNNVDAIKSCVFTYSEMKLYAIGGKLISCNIVDKVRFDETLLHGENTWFIYQLLRKVQMFLFCYAIGTIIEIAQYNS